MATRAPGMAASDPSRRQQRTAQRSVPFQRRQSVCGAGGLEAAGRTQPGTEQQAITPHKTDQQGPRQTPQRRGDPQRQAVVDWSRCGHGRDVVEGGGNGSAARHGTGAHAPQRIAQQRTDFVAQCLTQRRRSGTGKGTTIERRTQSQHPSTRHQIRQAGAKALPCLALDEVAGHGTACMPLGHHQPQFHATPTRCRNRRGQVIHSPGAIVVSTC